MRPLLFSGRDHNPYIILIQKGVWLVCSFLIAIWFSWHLLANVNFLYPVWYEFGGIKENIEQYAPLNHYREDFVFTTDEKRIELFAQIVTAIQNQGQNLNLISYENLTGKIPLLRTAEIIHLQDVANLISFLNQLLWGIFILWMAITMALFAKIASFPTIKQASTFMLSTVVIGTIILIYYGAETIFYQLHIWVFPPDNQWFFYYQESLMSTMMKAPYLFAYIGLSLLALSIAIFYLILKIFNIKL